MVWQRQVKGCRVHSRSVICVLLVMCLVFDNPEFYDPGGGGETEGWWEWAVV